MNRQDPELSAILARLDTLERRNRKFKIMRARLAFAISALVIASVTLLVWHFQSTKHATESPVSVTPSPTAVISDASAATHGATASSDSAPTNVYAHNLMLRKGPGFRVYVRWLRGQMIRAHRNVNPSFDEPDSFVLDVKTGVIHTNVGDLTNFLNDEVANSPLRNITLSGDGDQIKLHGTLHKIIPLPIEMIATIGVAPANRIQIHVTKLSLLKIPFKALLGGFHITIHSLFHPGDIPGIEVSGNDIFLDTQKLLPPPHIRGQLTSVRIVNPDFEEIYGDAKEDVTRVAQWRNFLQLRDGTIDFGKLTMRHVDLIMVDLSNDAWFDLDLAHYQEQLVNGYTRMTPEAGLQIFMPDVDEVPHNKANQNISMEWLKNRNASPPPDVTSR
jgi:hypothetical protein